MPGLYIHVPFCAGKCPYCDFYSIDDLSLVSAWLTAVEKEMFLYREVLDNFSTLYLGGGTPSLLSADQLETLVRLVRRHFVFCDDPEITLEANPGDLTKEKLAVLRHLGINRISLGVQSLDDAVLRFLNRRHTAEAAQKAIEDIRKTGFENLSIDLMYSVPGQGKDGWLETLNRAIAFSPDHFSCYELTVKENTPFFGLKAQGKLETALSGEDAFLLTSDILEQNGYIHYEVSSFARKETLYSRHNQKYWQHVPYLGLGPSAHSFDGNSRWWNVSSADAYGEALNQGIGPVAENEVLSEAQKDLESLFLGFRTKKGIALDSLDKYKKVEIVIDRLVESKLIIVDAGRAVPTKKGFLFADRLPLYFDRENVEHTQNPGSALRGINPKDPI